MKVVYLMLQISIVLGFVSTAAGQSFPCNGQLFISTNDGVSTTLSRPIAIPFNPPFLSPFSRYENGSLDALGFNSKDNFIYGVQEHTNFIVKLSMNNTFEQIGSVSFLDTLKSNAGDCSPEGLYFCHDYELHQILVFDVVDEFKLLNRVELFWDPNSVNSGVFKTRIFDFAFDPNNPTVAYSYQGNFEHKDLGPEETRGYMLQINLNFNDPNLGMVTPLELLNQNTISHIGALLFTPKSDLFAYGTTTSGLNPIQNTLYSINAFTGQASQMLIKNPGVAFSDGCSCPFSFTFSNEVPTEGMYCNNDDKNFIFKIDNNAFIPVNDVTLIDTFPKGMIIEQISNTFTGNIAIGTGVGFGVLEISELQIPAKTTVEIRVKVRSVDAEVGHTTNQAFLQNLPARFEGDMGSDDLGSIGVIGDPSDFIIIARELKEVSWEVTSPSDCINANDGKIILTSPHFFPEQLFEVKLRNKVGWEEMTTQVIIDQNNAFTIDSLIPGDYQIFHVRSVSDNCSLALKDTTVVVEAPNDLLDIQVNSNSPICEGELLLLNSAVSPAGNIQWKGPESFGSETQNPIIVNTDSEKSGEYMATVEYGFCTKSEVLNVAVKPEAKVSILGDSLYCERDTLQLVANGNGENLEYKWTGPHNLNLIDSVLSIPNIGNNQTGYYEVISSNGACFDTTGIEIVVSQTPTLFLDNVLKTDFCNSVILDPEITGGSNLIYEWFPQEGLSCSDCPSPELQTMVQSGYTIKVVNEFLCIDSASVEIILDQNKLFYAPNIFKRSSTTGNERFTIFPGCVIHYIHSIELFDRWGNLVFNSTAKSPNESIELWDGLINGKNGNNGVYTWIAKIELVDGSIQYLSGDVTLLN